MKKVYLLILSGCMLISTNGKPEQRPNADYLIIEDPKTDVGANAEYRKLYERKLFVTPGDLARYVQLPGPLAQTEIAVSVHKQEKGSYNYWITLTEPGRRLADCDPIDPTLPKVNPDTIKVRRDDAPIPDSTALALHRLWLTMLEQAKPDPCKNCSGEATNEIFSARAPSGKLLQALWVYEGEKTVKLVNIAIRLVEYCRAPADQREKLARDIEKKALELQNLALPK